MKENKTMSGASVYFIPQHASIWTNHISSAWWAQVLSGYYVGQHRAWEEKDKSPILDMVARDRLFSNEVTF